MVILRCSGARWVISAGNSHLAALHRNKAAERVQQRGFSASRRAQQGNHLSLLDRQIDIM
jgi:hypothetical protein